MCFFDRVEGKQVGFKTRRKNSQDSRTMMDCQKQEPGNKPLGPSKALFHMVRTYSTSIPPMDDLQGTLCPGRPDRAVSDDPIDEQSNPCEVVLPLPIKPQSQPQERGTCGARSTATSKRHDDHHDKVLKENPQRLSSRKPAPESRFSRTHGVTDHHH